MSREIRQKKELALFEIEKKHDRLIASIVVEKTNESKLVKGNEKLKATGNKLIEDINDNNVLFEKSEKIINEANNNILSLKNEEAELKKDINVLLVRKDGLKKDIEKDKGNAEFALSEVNKEKIELSLMKDAEIDGKNVKINSLSLEEKRLDETIINKVIRVKSLEEKEGRLNGNILEKSKSIDYINENIDSVEITISDLNDTINDMSIKKRDLEKDISKKEIDIIAKDEEAVSLDGEISIRQKELVKIEEKVKLGKEESLFLVEREDRIKKREERVDEIMKKGGLKEGINS